MCAIRNSQQEPSALQWKWMDEDSSGGVSSVDPFKNLFIFEGQQIFDFVQTAILKKLSPLCQIDGYKTSVYKLPSTGDHIVVTEDSDLDQTGQMTELLSPWLEKAEIVYLFPFRSAYTYNTQDEFDKRCFIRTISNTTVEKVLDGMAAMEDCNIVYGLSAGGMISKSPFYSIQFILHFLIAMYDFFCSVSTWRHIHNLPFVCYTVYMDCVQIDSFVASSILKLLNDLRLKCDTSYVVKTPNKSNLYM